MTTSKDTGLYIVCRADEIDIFSSLKVTKEEWDLIEGLIRKTKGS